MGSYRKCSYEYKGKMLTVNEIAEIEGCSNQHIYDVMNAFSAFSLDKALELSRTKGLDKVVFRLTNIKSGIILEGDCDDLKELVGDVVLTKNLARSLNECINRDGLYLKEWKVERLGKRRDILTNNTDIDASWEEDFKIRWNKMRRMFGKGA